VPLASLELGLLLKAILSKYELETAAAQRGIDTQVGT
jgi:hypothetical protein